MSTVAIVEDNGPLRVFLREALTAMGWTVTGIAGRRPAPARALRPA
jgi:hypothetical protein